MFIFFFNDTATTEIYTLSLHDALPIWRSIARIRDGARSTANVSVSRRALAAAERRSGEAAITVVPLQVSGTQEDRKSTRLNSSHANIVYPVLLLKKKNNYNNHRYLNRY